MVWSRRKKDKREIAEEQEDQKYWIKVQDPESGKWYQVITLEEFPDQSDLYSYIKFSGRYQVFATKPKLKKIDEYFIEDLEEPPENWPAKSKKTKPKATDSDEMKKLKRVVKDLKDKEKKREEEERFKRLEDKFDKAIDELKDSRSKGPDALEIIKVVTEMSKTNQDPVMQELMKGMIKDLRQGSMKQGDVLERLQEFKAFMDLAGGMNPGVDPWVHAFDKGTELLDKYGPILIDAWSSAEEAKNTKAPISLEEMAELEKQGKLPPGTQVPQQPPPAAEAEITGQSEDFERFMKMTGNLPLIAERIKAGGKGKPEIKLLFKSPFHTEAKEALETLAEVGEEELFKGIEELKEIALAVPTGKTTKTQSEGIATLILNMDLAEVEEYSSIKTIDQTQPFVDRLVEVLDVLLSEDGRKYITEALEWVRSK